MSGRARADAGHIVYTGTHDTGGRNAPQVETENAYATECACVYTRSSWTCSRDPSAHAAIERVISEQGRIDVLMQLRDMSIARRTSPRRH